MVRALNDLASGTPAPLVEESLNRVAVAHHFVDTDDILGLGAPVGHPLRVALHRFAGPGRWALLLPRPGHPAGMRGPVALNAAALDAGQVVIRHDGGLALVPTSVGPAIQWTIHDARAPELPSNTAEANRVWSELVARLAAELHGLGSITAGRPLEADTPVLGRCYPPQAQRLLDRAWPVFEALRAAGGGAHPEPLSSHGALAQERALLELERAAASAVQSALSWPLVEHEGQ